MNPFQSLALRDWFRRKSRSLLQLTVEPPAEVQPIIGWRGWNLKDCVLNSVYKKAEWPCRKAMQANDPNWATDKEPNGIHALRLRKELLSSGYAGDIFGEVYLWGKISEYALGFRAEFAYPKSLFVSEKCDPITVMQVEENYGVPVEVAEDFPKEIVDVFPWYPTPPPSLQQMYYDNTALQLMKAQIGSPWLTKPFTVTAGAVAASMPSSYPLMKIDTVSKDDAPYATFIDPSGTLEAKP